MIGGTQELAEHALHVLQHGTVALMRHLHVEEHLALSRARGAVVLVGHQSDPLGLARDVAVVRAARGARAMGYSIEYPMAPAPRAEEPQGGARERNEREVERRLRKERSLGWDRRKRGVRGKCGNPDNVEIDWF